MVTIWEQMYCFPSNPSILEFWKSFDKRGCTLADDSEVHEIRKHLCVTRRLLRMADGICVRMEGLCQHAMNMQNLLSSYSERGRWCCTKEKFALSTSIFGEKSNNLHFSLTRHLLQAIQSSIHPGALEGLGNHVNSCLLSDWLQECPWSQIALPQCRTFPNSANIWILCIGHAKNSWSSGKQCIVGQWNYCASPTFDIWRDINSLRHSTRMAAYPTIQGSIIV